VNIRIDDLQKSFPVDGQRKPVLRDVSLDIASGEFVCVLGPSGCGKSTILNILSGLDSDYEGQIRIDGKALAECKPHLSYIFQEPRLLPWKTVRGNFEFVLSAAGVPKKEWDKRIDHYLGIVNMRHTQDMWIHQLSGGMRHRVAIARAFIIEPEVLLMDEPFSALDELTAREIRIELLKLWREHKRTVIFVTHNAHEATFMADRVILLDSGPATIREVHQVGVPRPREYDSEEVFAENKRLVGRFLEIIGRS
jgi:ABC-type nitrate/sulfonate/bicarbonate transport system ATPase subunit